MDNYLHCRIDNKVRHGRCVRQYDNVYGVTHASTEPPLTPIRSKLMIGINASERICNEYSVDDSTEVSTGEIIIADKVD